VVEEAARPESPLHPYFTWDRDEAARLRLLDEARQMLGAVECVVVVRTEAGYEQTNVRRYHNVSVQVVGPADAAPLPPQRVYVNLERVATSEELAAQVVDAAYRQLRSWQSRHRAYLSLPAFQGRFGAIMELIDGLDQRQAR
jgi:hypothetical protein